MPAAWTIHDSATFPFMSTTSLKRDPGTALHRQVFLVLKEQIAHGLYAPGSSIPTEEKLCETFGVSRITVRRAIADLQQMGLLDRQPGRGTFVKAEVRPSRAHPSLGLLESLSKQARETDVTVLAVAVAEAPSPIAAQLGLIGGERAVHAVRLRSAKGVPLMVTDAWVPERVGSHITAAALRKKALFEILMAEGVKFGRVVQELSAVAADPHYASLLQTDVGAPLLRLVRLIYDRKRQPVQHLTIHVTSERSRLLMDVPADAVNTTGAGQIIHDV